MREVLEKIEQLVEIIGYGEPSEYNDGQLNAYNRVIELFNEHLPEMLRIGDLYYVLNYEGYNKSILSIERMRLIYKKTVKNKDYFYFHSNPDANILTVNLKDCVCISSKEEVAARVFFSREEAVRFTDKLYDR